MTNINAYEKLRNETERKTEEDYHVPVAQPYNKSHLAINEVMFSDFTRPAYFDLSHLGLDYDCHDVKDAEFVHNLSANQDLQNQRFKQNPKRSVIQESIITVGKDIREKPVFLVKTLDKDGSITYRYIQDGNTFVDIGKQVDIPNYLVAEFWTNSKWSEANAIAIGVYLNTLEKDFGAAEEDDYRNGLLAISKTNEFIKLMKDTKTNFKILSEKLTNYYFKMSNKTETSVTVQKIINDIICENDSVKKQNINPTNESITKQLKDAGFVDNSSTIYSVNANYPEKTVTQHLRTRISICQYKATRIGVILYTSGSINHNRYWWIVESYKMISEIESFMDMHDAIRGGAKQTKFFIAAVYQNHEGTSHKFPLGSFVHPEDIKTWHQQLKDNDEI